SPTPVLLGLGQELVDVATSFGQDFPQLLPVDNASRLPNSLGEFQECGPQVVHLAALWLGRWRLLLEQGTPRVSDRVDPLPVNSLGLGEAAVLQQLQRGVNGSRTRPIAATGFLFQRGDDVVTVPWPLRENFQNEELHVAPSGAWPLAESPPAPA